jgi:hypothetical protein
MDSTLKISSQPSVVKTLVYPLIAAAAAATASGSSAALALPVWAMFIGWVAFFTRGPSVKDGVWNALCLLVGIALGMLAALTTGVLAPLIGAMALPAVVFVVAVLVLSLRLTRRMNNVLCYFLGLITFFASRLPPNATTFSELSGAVVIGLIAGGVTFVGQRRLMKI